MENGFKPLECNDDDVLSFDNKELFKISKFKEQLESSLNSKVNNWFYPRKIDRSSQEERLVDQSRIGISGLGAGLGNITITWNLPSEGKECEILRLGAKNWEKGKVRVQASLELYPNETESEKRSKIQFCIEFAPDTPEIIPPESPLDDLRQMISQETQTQS